MHGPSFIEHKGTQVVLLDFSGIQDPALGMPLIAESGRFVQALPPGSVLSCTDVTDTKYDRQVVDAFKAMSAGNRPHVKAAAVVTNSALHRAAIGMVGLFSRRKLEVFDSKAKALDWLVSQA